MNGEDKMVAVVGGSADVERPLVWHLQRNLLEPVVSIDWQDPEDLRHQLQQLADRGSVTVLASNELALNASAACGVPVDLPGTGQVDGTCLTAAALSDKAQLLRALADRHLQDLDVVDARVLHVTEQASLPTDLVYPLVVKPAARDPEDSFTAAFPSKIAILEDEAALRGFLTEHHRLLAQRQLIMQQLACAPFVSWFGAIHQGDVLSGCAIVPQVKSPNGVPGGSTSLALRRSSDAQLAAAVRELAKELCLDGVFEIEFGHLQSSNGPRLAFLHDLNPRPILQTAMLLKDGSSPFLDYLLRRGFQQKLRPGGTNRNSWGSASRYLAHCPKATRSLGQTLRIARRDVRFGPWYSWPEKLRYAATLATDWFRRPMRR